MPNRAVEELTRPSYAIYKDSIHHELAKLQKQGKCIILPVELLRGMQGLHTSAVHVVIKPGDKKIRVCTDAAASGLNDGTDMDDVVRRLGEFNLPSLQALATMLCGAAADGCSLLYKTDVSSAFTTMRLSVDASMTQALQFGEYIFIPLVSMFGGAPTPGYYNVISGAINWAHNGGVNRVVLQGWKAEQQLAAGHESIMAISQGPP